MTLFILKMMILKQLLTAVEVNSGGYLPSREAVDSQHQTVPFSEK